MDGQIGGYVCMGGQVYSKIQMDTHNNEEMDIQLNILTQVSVSINCNCVTFLKII